MLLYMINDPEETSISKQTFVNPTAFHTLNHTDYIRREREGRMEAVRWDWLHLLLLLTLACLVIVIVRVPPEDPIPRLPGTDRRETLAFWSPTSGQYTMHQT